MKLLHLAIRIHKSSTPSVTAFSLLPKISTSFKKKLHQYNVWSYYEAIPTRQTSSLGFWDSPRTYVLRFLQSLYRKQTGESASPRWKRKRPVSSKLYSNLYWNHLRQIPHVVLKIFSKVALVSISVGSILLHFSMHFDVSPDVILCGWLGLKHQLTNKYILVYCYSRQDMYKYLEH